MLGNFFWNAASVFEPTKTMFGDDTNQLQKLYLLLVIYGLKDFSFFCLDSRFFLREG